MAEEMTVSPVPTLADLQAEVGAPYRAALGRLVECFFGTVAERDPSEGVRRPKHLHDGWRDGVSHPCSLGDREYDARDTHQESRQLYENLQRAIEAQWELAVIARNEALGRPCGFLNAPTKAQEEKLRAVLEGGPYSSRTDELQAMLTHLKRGGVEVSFP
jgi:hypothetical protein